MKNKTLVILAAGMGSRFGGLKQIEPVGPNGEIIADYSVYDAINAGFNKVVFVIKEEHLDYFKENITKNYENKIQVEFVFQSLDKIPNDVVLPDTREKMLGTGHALLVAKEKVNEPFIMINSDDFYGASAYKIAADFLDNNKDEYEYMSVNYPFYLATTENGKVNRGLVTLDGEYVKTVEECTMNYHDGKVLAINKKTDEEMIVEKDHPVSINFYAFKPSFFTFLEKDFNTFIYSEIDDTKEYFLTDVIRDHINNGDIKFRNALSTSRWLGVTYREDLANLKDNILKLIREGEYPEDLWK